MNLTIDTDNQTILNEESGETLCFLKLYNFLAQYNRELNVFKITSAKHIT